MTDGARFEALNRSVGRAHLHALYGCCMSSYGPVLDRDGTGAMRATGCTAARPAASCSTIRPRGAGVRRTRSCRRDHLQRPSDMRPRRRRSLRMSSGGAAACAGLARLRLRHRAPKHGGLNAASEGPRPLASRGRAAASIGSIGSGPRHAMVCGPNGEPISGGCGPPAHGSVEPCAVGGAWQRPCRMGIRGRRHPWPRRRAQEG